MYVQNDVHDDPSKIRTAYVSRYAWDVSLHLFYAPNNRRRDNIGKIFTESQRRKEQKTSIRFFTGAWEVDWLHEAEKANALWVAIYLLRLSTMRKSGRMQFTVTQTAEELGTGRLTLWRNLNALE